MSVLFSELVRQHAANTKVLLSKRKRSRVAVVILSYLLVAIAGVATAAIIADNANGDLALLGVVIVAPAALIVLLSFRARAKGIEKSLDRSLDVIAATRAMAIEANVPANEQAHWRNVFYELQDRRARGLFGEKRTLL